MNRQVDVSFCIGARNTREYLKIFIESIYLYTKGISYEIFVVDSNSSDGTSGMVKECFENVKLLHNDGTKGFAYSINQCLQQMTGRYAVVLTSDTYLIEDAFSKLTDFMDKNSSVGICQPKILNPDLSIQDIGRKTLSFYDELKRIFRIFSWEPLSMGNDPDEISEVEVVSGACMFIRQKVIQKIGLLEEGYFLYHEEDDYCIRARNNGWKVFVYPKAAIVHHIGQSTIKEQSPLMKVVGYWGQLFFIKKHFGFLKFSFFLFCSKLVIILKMMIYFLKLSMRQFSWLEFTTAFNTELVMFKIIKLSKLNLNKIISKL